MRQPSKAQVSRSQRHGSPASLRWSNRIAFIAVRFGRYQQTQTKWSESAASKVHVFLCLKREKMTQFISYLHWANRWNASLIATPTGLGAGPAKEETGWQGVR